MRRPLAHPPEPAYPCCLPALGGFSGVTPHEGSAKKDSPSRASAEPPRPAMGWRSTRARPVSLPAEDSPSGLGRTLGKRVGGNPSRVQISYPPPEAQPPTSGNADRGLLLCTDAPGPQQTPQRAAARPLLACRASSAANASRPGPVGQDATDQRKRVLQQQRLGCRERQFEHSPDACSAAHQLRFRIGILPPALGLTRCATDSVRSQEMRPWKGRLFG